VTTLFIITCGKAANLAFLKPDFEIIDFLTHSHFLESQRKAIQNLAFFSRKGKALSLSCVFTTNPFWLRVHTSKEYW